MSNPAAIALKDLNTFGVQAWAEHCHIIDSIETAQHCLAQYGPPELILSGGSNILLVKEKLGQVWINRMMGRSVLSRDASQVTIIDWIALGAKDN